MARSGIEWTESTWNPLTGCTKISPGCKHCYAERMAKRLKAMGQPNYINGFKLTMHEHVLEKKARRTRSWFVSTCRASPGLVGSGGEVSVEADHQDRAVFPKLRDTTVDGIKLRRVDGRCTAASRRRRACQPGAQR